MNLPLIRPLLGFRHQTSADRILENVSPLLLKGLLRPQHMVKEPLLPVRSLHAPSTPVFCESSLQRPHPVGQRKRPRSESHKKMHVVWHQNVPPDQNLSLRAISSKVNEHSTCFFVGQNGPAPSRARGKKIDRAICEEPVEPCQSRWMQWERSLSFDFPISKGDGEDAAATELPPARLQHFFRVEFGDVDAAHGLAQFFRALSDNAGIVVVRCGADDRLRALLRV